MKPFDLEEAKAGKPVCTRDGRNVRIICFDVKHERFQLLALVEDGERESSISVDNDGKFDLLKKESSLDLFMKTEKHEGWGWLGEYATVYSSEELALANKPKCECKFFLAKVEWEE